jgi:serine/threonine protein phosphatase PrpC
MVKNIISTFYSNKKNLNIDNLNDSQLDDKLIHKSLNASDYSLIKSSYKKAEKDLTFAKFDCNLSGCTALTIFLIDDILICANAGDSRAILVVEKDGIHIVPLSRDHKPNLEDERRRITKNGGQVEQISNNGRGVGPYRVWLKNKTYPGLAMSRSVGDFLASSVGVTCEPEMSECLINEYCKYLVMGSDGLWEFMDNEDVLSIVNAFYPDNVEGAVNALVNEATKRWNKVISF